jgi:predicted lipoprotein
MGTRQAELALCAGLIAVAVATAAGGCERVAYYSVTGATGDGPSTTAPVGPGPGPGPGPGGGGEVVVTRADVLASVGACANTLYADAATTAAAFATAAAAHQAAPDGDSAEAAEYAWATAMAAWQRAELVRVGIAGPVAQPTGQSLRDYVYSWPLVSRCLVEQGLVSQAYTAGDFGATALINVRGFAAAEYLLFYAGTDNACSAGATINTSGSWAALGAAELAARKRAYAAVVAADLQRVTGDIATAWSPGGGDFAGELARAGQGGAAFESEQKALNAISDGLFYIETEVKDAKLARPLGLVECEESSCPGAVESQYALVARDHITHNLEGFAALYAGCEASENVGFDDLLRTLGATALADEMDAALAGALAAAAALDDADLIAALARDRAGVEALHAAVKQITDRLKTDFVGVLDLELPMNVEGDND